MILLPYTHEQTTVRRLPWVTLGIMALCLVAFVLSGRWRMVPREDLRIQKDFLAAIEWYVQHPYLELDPEFEEVFLNDLGGARVEEMLGYFAELGRTAPLPSVVRAEQEQFDAMTSRALASLRNHPLRRWGLVPTEKKAVSWIGHMFLHAGWLHLLGNMLILFLAGPFIEDVWGRPLFAGFYLASGLLAASFHILSDPEASRPMIGASGAIAGVMGAFLIRYGTTKIKFFYLFLLIRGTFWAPAWLMIPLWFASQLWMGLLTSELDIQLGVAYWAHIGGFAAGVGVAWFVAARRIEERFIHPNIERKITLEVRDNQDVVGALEVRESDPERAFRMLSLTVMNQPQNHDGAAALWELALDLGRTSEAAPLMLRSIGQQLRAGDADLAVNQWLDVRPHVERADGDPRPLVRLAQALVERDHGEEAAATLQLALQANDGAVGPMVALNVARIARDLRPSIAREAARRVLDHPQADPELRQRARGLLDELGSGEPRPLSVVTDG